MILAPLPQRAAPESGSPRAAECSDGSIASRSVAAEARRGGSTPRGDLARPQGCRPVVALRGPGSSRSTSSRNSAAAAWRARSGRAGRPGFHTAPLRPPRRRARRNGTSTNGPFRPILLHAWIAPRHGLAAAARLARRSAPGAESPWPRRTPRSRRRSSSAAALLPDDLRIPRQLLQQLPVALLEATLPQMRCAGPARSAPATAASPRKSKAPSFVARTAVSIVAVARDHHDLRCRPVPLAELRAASPAHRCREARRRAGRRRTFCRRTTSRPASPLSAAGHARNPSSA